MLPSSSGTTIEVVTVDKSVVIEIYDAKIEFDYNLICYDGGDDDIDVVGGDNYDDIQQHRKV